MKTQWKIQIKFHIQRYFISRGKSGLLIPLDSKSTDITFLQPRPRIFNLIFSSILKYKSTLETWKQKIERK